MVPNSFTHPAGVFDDVACAASLAGDTATIEAITTGAKRHDKRPASMPLSSFNFQVRPTKRIATRPAAPLSLQALVHCRLFDHRISDMNVVFDLGGVVVAWRPVDIVARAFADPDTRDLVHGQIVGHPDWLELDRGTLTLEAAIARAVARTGMREAEVRAFIEGVPASLVADSDAVALLRRVHAAGHRLFCLSNMPTFSMDHLEREYDFWNLFTGKVISSRVGHCKPEPAIYEHLLATYELDPEETIFIDDVEANVAAAAVLGIQTIRFESVVQCERELRLLGCL
jgi:putative hydrolase of the HAD superfamily